MCFEILALYKDRERPVGFLFIPAFRNLSNLLLSVHRTVAEKKMFDRTELFISF